MFLPFVIGIVASAGIAVFARKVGLDRDGAFYPTVMIVIALYYVLFAVMTGSMQTVLAESVMVLFAAAAVAGFKSSAWLVAAALAGHGAFDAIHGYVIDNPGVPMWWPAWCFAYDVGAAAGLAWLLRRGLVPNALKA
jgi:general stress protein CsbA